MDIKRRFPDEGSVREHIRSLVPAIKERLERSVGEHMGAYQSARSERNYGSALITIGVVLFGIGVSPLDSDVSMPGEWVVVFLGVAVIGAFVAYAGGRRLVPALKTIRQFNERFNAALYPEAFGVFGLNAVRIENRPAAEKDPADPTDSPENAVDAEDSAWSMFRALKKNTESPNHTSTIALLDHSELITESRNRVTVDDCFNVLIDGRNLFAAELDVRHVTGSGKNRRVKKIFKGYFAAFDLPRPLTGKTFVSTEGDKRGFGHQSFFSALGSDVRTTELEWNDFEKLLHVASNDPSEARYILTPDFMHDLYEWWKEKKQNIRLSFLDNRMYVLFPNQKLRLGRTVESLSEPELTSYLETICLPLVHVLHLIEDVNRQMR